MSTSVNPAIETVHARCAPAHAPSHHPPGAISALRRGLAASLHHVGLCRAAFTARQTLRILGYHGVCPDDLIDEPWIPSHFVSVSGFRAQLDAALRFARFVNLGQSFLACDHWDAGPALAITFDDVPACTAAHALPILAERGIRATLFISTGNATRQELFPADVVRLAAACPHLLSASAAAALAPLSANRRGLKRLPPAELNRHVEPARVELHERLPAHVWDTLRPMNWSEIQHAARKHEIGAHTCDHVVLGSTARDARRHQIAASITTLRAQLDQRIVGFAYPNGGPGDYDEGDATELNRCGVRYAVSTRCGDVRRSDRLDLPRLCIGRTDTLPSLSLALSGLLDQHRRRQQGWR